MTSAATCFASEIAARQLVLPERLRGELETAVRAPFTARRRLLDRLIAGTEVIRAQGDLDAPAELWDRWEAIFVAWWCCEDEVAANVEKGARTQRRAAWKPKSGIRFVQRETTKE